jgi:oligopeptide transport system substrate-binding protein
MSLATTEKWTVALEKYETDRADLFALEPFAPREMDRVRQRHGGEYVSLPSGITYYLSFGVTRPPFDDRRVRQALALAFDRQALADAEVGSYHSPATGGFVPPGLPGHCPGIALPHDPQQARELLASAGYPGGAGFPEVELMSFPRWKGVCDHLRSVWQQHLGLEIGWQVVDFSELVVASVSETPLALRFGGWGAEYPDPDGFLGAYVQSVSGWGPGQYLDLVERARRSTDQSERMALYAQAERLLVKEVPLLPLLYTQQHLLLKPWVRSYRLSVMGNPFWKDVILEPH